MRLSAEDLVNSAVLFVTLLLTSVSVYNCRTVEGQTLSQYFRQPDDMLELFSFPLQSYLNVFVSWSFSRM
jgi:hypothetical protein